MVMATKTPQGARLNPQNTLELSQGMSIQVAIDTANAHGGEWTILLYPGAPYREGDITHVGVANITIKSMGPERVVIAPTVAPATGVIVSGAILTLDGVDVTNPDLTMPALRVTGGTCDCKDCEFNQVGGAGGNVIEQVAGILTLCDCETDVGAIDLRDAGCTLTIHGSTLNGPLVTDDGGGADEVMNVTVRHCDCHNQAFNLGATGACVYEFFSNNEMGAITDASQGAAAVNGHICRCHITGAGLVKNGTTGWLVDNSELAAISNTDATGGITVYGGIVVSITRAVGSIVWWLDNNTLKVIPSGTITDTVIQWAVAAAGAGDTVVIHPGTYEEAVTLAAGINLVGVDKEHCIIDIDHATLITMAEGCYVANLTLDVTADATGSGTGVECNDINCRIEDLLINITRTASGGYGIHEDTGDTARTIYIRNVRLVSEDTITYGFRITRQNKTVHIENCFVDCYAGFSLGQASTVYSEGNKWNGATTSLSISNGTVRLSHDTIVGPINRTGAGVLTYKNAEQQYEVWAGMLIQDAIGAAAAPLDVAPSADYPYTILIHPGIYDEAITCATWVNLKGIGPKGSVVIYQNDANIVTLADNVELQNFTVRLGTPTFVGKHLIIDNNVACTARMTDLVLQITTPAALPNYVFNFTGAGDYIIERCSYNIGGTGIAQGIRNGTNAATIHLIDNDFTFTNINAIHISSGIAGTWTCKGNYWAGTCIMLSIWPGTLTFDNCAILCPGTWTIRESIITLRNCAIEAPVFADILATVRLKNCSYRVIQRVGTGNIVDESPDLKDAPWHVDRWDWQAVLANAQVALRGVPLDAGSGQVIIETLDSGAGVMAVETSPEIAQALGNHFTPARTPRFLTQISAHTDDGSGEGQPAFDPDVAMFFGLRNTLGPALPVHPEHHAGFIWTGAAFEASSNDGVATQTTTPLATPSDDVQHQLEVIVFGGITEVGWVEFYVDGVLVATHGDRIPVDTLDWQHLIIGLTTGAGAGDTISVTVRPGGTQECPA